MTTFEGQVEHAGPAQEPGYLGQGGGQLGLGQVQQRGAGPHAVETACGEGWAAQVGADQRSVAGSRQRAWASIPAERSRPADPAAESGQEIQVAARPAAQVQHPAPTADAPAEGVERPFQAQIAPAGGKLGGDLVIAGGIADLSVGFEVGLSMDTKPHSKKIEARPAGATCCWRRSSSWFSPPILAGLWQVPKVLPQLAAASSTPSATLTPPPPATLTPTPTWTPTPTITPTPTPTPLAHPIITALGAEVDDAARTITFHLEAQVPPDRQVAEVLLWYDTEAGPPGAALRRPVARRSHPELPGSTWRPRA